MTRVLALDLGTSCGWAFVSELGNKYTGTWDCAPKRLDSPAMRFIKFESALMELRLCDFEFEHIIYERVDFAKTTIAAQIWGGFNAVLLSYCHKYGISFEGVSVTELKRFATGKGNAKKPDMIEAARRFGWEPIDDNSADACCLLEYALQSHKA